MALEGHNRKAAGRGRPGGNGPSSFNVFGMVVGYEVQTPKRGEKIDPANDYMLVGLWRDAGPLKYAQSEDGQLQTVVRVSLKTKEANADGYQTLSIAEMKRGRPPAATPLAVGSFVAFRDVEAVPGETGKFRAERVDAAVRGFNADLHHVHSGMVSVKREWTNKRDGEDVRTQSREVLLTEQAQVFNCIDLPEGADPEQYVDFRTAAVNAFAAADVLGASAQVVIRGIQKDAVTGGYEYALERSISLWDPQNRVELTPGDAVERFINGEDGTDGHSILAEVGTSEHVMFEVIPQYMYRTGKASLPSSRRKTAQDGGKYDPKFEFRYDDSLACRYVNAEGKFESGYIQADIAMGRREVEDEELKATMPYTRPYSLFFREQRKGLGRFPRAEVITPNLEAWSPALVESLNKRAQDNRVAAIAAEKAQTSSNAPKKEEQAPEHEEPETAPGMGMGA